MGAQAAACPHLGGGDVLNGRAATVLLAGSDSGRRDELREQLERRGYDVVATAADALGAVCAVLEATPEVCVLDAELTGGAVEAAEQVERQLPGVRVVLLTGALERRGLAEQLGRVLDR